MDKLENSLRNRFRIRNKHRSDGVDPAGTDQGGSQGGDIETFEVLECSKPPPQQMPGLSDRETDLTVFEHQLTTLHEQLVAVMIDNQDLNSRLRGYEDKASIQKLRIEMEIERKRYRDLEEKYSALETKSIRDRRIHRNRAGRGNDSKASRTPELAEDASVVAENEERDHITKRPSSYLPGFIERFSGRMVQFVYDTMDDFTEGDHRDGEEEQTEGDPLTVKKLKENINRFGNVIKPYANTFKGIHSLLNWKSPAYTLLAFVVYMYCVWMGWLLPLILFMLVFRLFVSYLRHHGFKMKFNYFDCDEEVQKAEESLGISDKFNLVLQVARKVQNALGSAADGLEKIKSLLTWRHPATRQLVSTFTMAFLMSCVLPSTYMMTMTGDMMMGATCGAGDVHSSGTPDLTFGFCEGLMFGVKLFIVDYFYNKYPRLKLKYDSSYKTWLSLPTDAQYEKECMKSELDKYVLIEATGEITGSGSEQHVTSQDRHFCALFSLPPTEAPLTGWKGGRRCALINREKAFAAAFKNGKLYLTTSFICFERKTSPSTRNIVIPLTDIVGLQKCKPYGILPGNGMALEIVVAGKKTFIFGGILNRDEAYDHIMETGLEKMLPWATGDPIVIDKAESGQSPAQPRKRNNGGHKFRNFSLASEYNDSD